MDTDIMNQARVEALRSLGADACEEIFNEFLLLYNQKIQELNELIELDDKVNLQKTTHLLKGAFLNIGADKSAEIVSNISFQNQENKSLFDYLKETTETFIKAYHSLR